LGAALPARQIAPPARPPLLGRRGSGKAQGTTDE